MGKEGKTSELEEVLDGESRFEVVRCNGRGGNECRLVGVVILFKPPVGNTPVAVNAKRRREAMETRVLPTRCWY